MSNKFVSVLDTIGSDIKKFFTNPVAQAIEGAAVSVVEIAVPATVPLLTAIQKSVVTAQGLAAAANTTGDTTAQVVALVLSDAQQAFQTYEKAAGVTVEPAQWQEIITIFTNLLDTIPGGSTATASTTTAAVAAAAKAAVATPQVEAVTGKIL